ncbi:MAG: HU family DNA-binding protein, partial [Desulfofustis sp.]|nr:HU family DNA-binding protein [Desulfofustis sp.]
TKVRRKARKGRNPQTGETIKIKASNSVRFKPGKTLKDSI